MDVARFGYGQSRNGVGFCLDQAWQGAILLKLEIFLLALLNPQMGELRVLVFFLKFLNVPLG